MKKNIRIKPSKSQSMLGFIAGLIFVFIGVFVAIPSSGLFGVLWTLIAIVITVTHGMNAFGNKGVATEIIEISSEDDLKIDGELRKGNVEEEYNFDEKLRKLKELRDDGILSNLEYERKKQEILNEKW
ncbi:SHOCT domain-containing protein [Clostridium perfringens]|nr:SHOCT domain-containing protein [Clostridium perfringens]